MQPPGDLPTRNWGIFNLVAKYRAKANNCNQGKARGGVTMARITLNQFVKRPTRIGIGFVFDDYHHIKKRTKIKGKLPLKTGGEVPTPNEVIRKLASSVKGDYHLKSGGAIQTLMLTDENDAKGFITPGSPLQPGDGKPLNAIVVIHMSMDQHMKLAKKLGLL